MKSSQQLSYKLAFIGLLAVVMTGCASNPYQTYDNTKTGALVGATIGALAQSGGNREDIAKGLAVGAAAGAGAGYAADRAGY
ncbi:hypothetical protein B0682_02395 [Moraxella lincolnii]|uniref:Glycine zipper 2TM domain-containing protein n=1 Tax=Lwoffella lincolnii TaxID=90241 RepID=A0A1T0CGW0_9GAMM|nr:hypothetical protein [Moraxella lincolnii]OOS21555.1 hypothetical protein B0682_02395 [Moraxella lincolnii]